MKVMAARFAGHCQDCGGPIAAGQTMKFDGKAHHLPGECGARVERPPKRVVHPDLTAGVYEKDGVVYVVKPTKDKTRLYAMKLRELPNARRVNEPWDRVAFEFEYDRGAVLLLAPDDRMDVERAKQLTIRYGRCINCGKGLKDAKSVERGIGPTCLRSFRVLKPVAQA